ncbi:MAG: glycosyltransferase [Candidatus Hydrogenedentes bacterium]|nr:glycosyltransferase [Candidatus Hydrogenedentota bacterium]
MAADQRTTEKKRILLLAESPYFGGITSHLLSILDAFRDSGRFEFVVATFPARRDDTTLIDAARERGVAVHVLAMASAWDWRVLRSLRRFAAEQRIDLIHTHNYRATLLCALAAPGPRVINTFHGMMVDPSSRLWFWQWAELIAMRRHRLTVACSEFLRDQLASQGLKPDHVRVVYNAYSPPDALTGSITRESLSIPNDRLIALFVGRLVSGKGVDTLIDATARQSGWTLVVAGDGPLRADLERQARDAKADVRFVGFTANVAGLYALADVVALPSRMEALPMTLIEAAAFGKPVVATRVGGIPEIVQDDVTGILVDYGDSAALGRALERLGAVEERDRMGAAAKAVWHERFSGERLREALGRVYDEALEG